MSKDKKLEKENVENKEDEIGKSIDENNDKLEAIRKKSKTRKFIAIGIIATLIIIIGVFLLWSNKSYSPTEDASKALKSDNVVMVNNQEYISFTPIGKDPTKGFIFYPGAKVEAESYAPLCREIAKEGFEVVIAKMPFNFAIFSPNEAQEIIDEYKHIDKWAIGGHSLGGVMAAKFASENEEVKGLALYASYPQGNELLNSNKKVVSMWGSEDSVLNMESLENSKTDLPKDTKFIEIKGANHAQFGDYGLQSGDSKALISKEEQTDIAAKNTIELLEKIK